MKMNVKNVFNIKVNIKPKEIEREKQSKHAHQKYKLYSLCHSTRFRLVDATLRKFVHYFGTLE